MAFPELLWDIQEKRGLRISGAPFKRQGKALPAQCLLIPNVLCCTMWPQYTITTTYTYKQTGSWHGNINLLQRLNDSSNYAVTSPHFFQVVEVRLEERLKHQTGLAVGCYRQLFLGRVRWFSFPLVRRGLRCARWRRRRLLRIATPIYTQRKVAT